MLNKFVKEQLKKCKTSLPEYDDNTTHLYIPLNSGFTTVSKGDIIINGNYDIAIENYIINEPANFTLSSNWNNGTKPPENLMNVDVLQVMGKMVRVSGFGKNTNIKWEGWLPRKGFKIC